MLEPEKAFNFGRFLYWWKMISEVICYMEEIKLYIYIVLLNIFCCHMVQVQWPYILCTKIVQDVYNWCIQDVYNWMYTKGIPHFDKLLYTNILYTFCIHQFWSTKSVHHKHYIYNLYTKFIQNTKLKGLWTAKIFIQNVYKILIYIPVQKLYIIRIRIKFVYKTCTKCKKAWGGTERDYVCTLTQLKMILGVLLSRILNNSSPSFWVRKI